MEAGQLRAVQGYSLLAMHFLVLQQRHLPHNAPSLLTSINANLMVALLDARVACCSASRRQCTFNYRFSHKQIPHIVYRQIYTIYHIPYTLFIGSVNTVCCTLHSDTQLLEQKK